MTEKRFEYHLNSRGEWDIIDNVESEEQTNIRGIRTLCIYNDLGVHPFSSAPHLCNLLNKLYEENEELKRALLFYLDLAIQDSSYLKDGFEKGMELWCQRLFNCSYSEMKKEYGEYDWADKWEMGK